MTRLLATRATRGATPVGAAALADRRAEWVLRAVACVVLALIVSMMVFVMNEAWPSFRENGLAWFGSGGNVDAQIGAIVESGADPANYQYKIRAFPLLYATALTTGLAILAGLGLALLTAVFIVEFAPGWVNRVLEPVVRLLAAVPSVIYGLIGLLVLVPFVNNNLISLERKESVAFVVQLTGQSLLVSVVILTVMITPIMIAISVDALRAVPKSWLEGAAALGVNRWRVMWTVAVRAARPGIVAAVILATARALGEAIMLSMVAGGEGFAPNPFDGLTFFYEPSRPLAATIVSKLEALTAEPMKDTLYAFAAILLFSSMLMSLAGWAAKRQLRRYGISP